MESEELRKQTASERLSLSQEYEMQQSWLMDANKCTFIVLDRNLYEATGNEVESMIGDANIYLSKNEENKIIGEIGLMIAEKEFRGKGYGKEILLCLMNFGIKRLGINRFIAVISLDNKQSIAMFQKYSFLEESRSHVFNEVSLYRDVDTDFVKYIDMTIQYLETSTEENK
ncbi:hypothetical protein O3M35_011473 [Rhynocoris fuscipes]|uniref:N-acetyltransferase domain-containing protein n=1 Tax=Rhynocoris fuscipes TaxID=488301 RepID=A0AAW1CY80_9HEMI